MTLNQKATVEVAAAQSKPAVLKGKVRYDKKAESEFFVDNSALAQGTYCSMLVPDIGQVR
jgi:hypothetical protein